MNILALNAGSTSLKFRLGEANQKPLFKGTAQDFDRPDAKLQITGAAGEIVAETRPKTLLEAADTVLQFAKSATAPLAAIGHRFVHGGPDLVTHRLIDQEVRAKLASACAFAPLHNPPALDVLSLVVKAFPHVPQVACLDTAFHANMPETSRRLPLPGNRLQNGVRRYGFHGLSCESVIWQIGKPPPRLVIAHLGGGASVTAVRDGVSVDTTMGLTPDGGVMMESRSGDLDPGLLVYLLRQGETADSLEQLLNRESGIAGVSSHGGDLRDVHAANDTDSRLAIDMFTSSVAKAIAGMATVLSGLDMVVFSGGIGEHDEQIRSAILERISWAGQPRIMVVPAEEEDMITRHAHRLAFG